MNTQTELVYHIETNHIHHSIKCDNCPLIFLTNEALVNNIVKEHTRNNVQQRNTLSNGVWTCAFCKVVFNGKEARDNHVCSEHSFQSVRQQESRRNIRTESCKRGDQCHFHKYGKCWYFHAQNVVRNSSATGNNSNTRSRNMTRQGQMERGNNRPTIYCQFQEGCQRRESCKFKHIDQDFLSQQSQRTDQ